MNEAFLCNKVALVGATMLNHPSPGGTFSFTSDATDRAVGAVLEQYVNNSWQTLAFFSKQLHSPEQKCSTFDRGLLEQYLAVRHFRFFLEGISFTILTDQKPLVGAVSKVSDPWMCDIRHMSSCKLPFTYSPNQRCRAGYRLWSYRPFETCTCGFNWSDNNCAAPATWTTYLFYSIRM